MAPSEQNEQDRHNPDDEYRDETDGERLDRKWTDLLQELRVMQTGAQLTAGFLLTLPFTPAFAEIDRFQRNLYLALVVLAAVTTALVLTPVATHRLLSGRQVKEQLVKAADQIGKLVLALVGALVVGIVVLIFDVATSRTTALVTGGVLAALVLGLMVALPHYLLRQGDATN